MLLFASLVSSSEVIRCTSDDVLHDTVPALGVVLSSI